MIIYRYYICTKFKIIVIHAHVFLEKLNVSIRNVEIKIMSLCTALKLTTGQVYTYKVWSFQNVQNTAHISISCDLLWLGEISTLILLAWWFCFWKKILLTLGVIDSVNNTISLFIKLKISWTGDVLELKFKKNWLHVFFHLSRECMIVCTN